MRGMPWRQRALFRRLRAELTSQTGHNARRRVRAFPVITYDGLLKTWRISCLSEQVTPATPRSHLPAESRGGGRHHPRASGLIQFLWWDLRVKRLEVQSAIPPASRPSLLPHILHRPHLPLLSDPAAGAAAVKSLLHGLVTERHVCQMRQMRMPITRARKQPQDRPCLSVINDTPAPVPSIATAPALSGCPARPA